MKTLRIETLKVGQRYSEAVYIEGNSLLVPAGVAIREKDIQRLRSWGIETVQTDGSLLRDEAGEPARQVPQAKDSEPAQDTRSSGTANESAGTNDVDVTPASLASASPKARKARPAALPKVLSLPAVQENKGSYRAYMELIDRLNALFSDITAGVSIESRAVDAITARLLQAVRENTRHFIGFILGGEVYGSELAKSSVNTAILSTLMAQDMKVPNHKVLQISTGALLHDVGMLKLPREILDSNRELSEGEVRRMQAHPLYTYKFICRELLLPEEVGLVALQHHERWDGEGYPRRLGGESIELGARIISVADAFEAMVSEKPYRNSMLGYQAMKNLLSDNSRRFDPDVLKSFIRTMGIYPIGSIVLLNSGALARVTNVHTKAPLRPEIRILIDEFGKAWSGDEGELVDLITEKSLFIARAIDPREYAADDQ